MFMRVHIHVKFKSVGAYRNYYLDMFNSELDGQHSLVRAILGDAKKDELGEVTFFFSGCNSALDLDEMSSAAYTVFSPHSIQDIQLHCRIVEDDLEERDV